MNDSNIKFPCTQCTNWVNTRPGEICTECVGNIGEGKVQTTTEGGTYSHFGTLVSLDSSKRDAWTAAAALYQLPGLDSLVKHSGIPRQVWEQVIIALREFSNS